VKWAEVATRPTPLILYYSITLALLPCYTVVHKYTTYIKMSQMSLFGIEEKPHMYFLAVFGEPYMVRQRLTFLNSTILIAGGRPGRIYHMMRAAADVMYCS